MMGVLNVVKTVSQSVGPSVTGWLARRKLIRISFIVAGSLKIVSENYHPTSASSRRSLLPIVSLWRPGHGRCLACARYLP